MPDPMDELENFTSPGLGMDPLPASEVRRRGNRLRRRNTALAAAGGVLAVAVIAAPFALMNGSHGSSDPQPVKPSPSVSWQQAIPADFPLAEGLPTPVDTTSTYESPVTDVCKGAGWDPGDAVDVRQATYTESEGGSTHALALYPTERDAERVLLGLQAAAQACALSTDGQDRNVEVLSSGQDGQTLVYANHYSDAGDLDAVQLSRVGNAVLQATRYSIGVPAQDTADQVMQGAEPVVGSMCVFSASGCGPGPSNAVDPSETAAPTRTSLPAMFPLLDGLPTRAATTDFGRYGPDQDHALLTIKGCGDRPLAKPDSTDGLRGGWHDPAEARDRELVVFATVGAAMDYLAAYEDLISCQPEDLGGGVTRIVSGAGSDLGLGDQAIIGVTWYRQDGNPAPGFRVTEMVRVANAVVVQDRIADGLNTPVTSAYLEQIIGESDQSLPGVVDAMDVFSS